MRPSNQTTIMNRKSSMVRSWTAAGLVWMGAVLATRTHGQARPEAPGLLTFQGSLVTADGTSIGETDAVNYPVVFRVFDAVTGGQLLWSEQQVVSVRKGAFSVVLGEGNPYANEPRPSLASLFESGTTSDRFVEMTVRGVAAGEADATVEPRTRLLATAYALLANRARTAQDMVNGNGVPVVRPLQDRVGINTSSPQAALDVAGSIGAKGLETRQGLSVTGLVEAAGLNGLGMAPVGTIIMWSSETPPAGWVLCDGSVVQGVTTPDLRGRFVLGLGSGPGLTPRGLNDRGGVEAHALDASQVPRHDHRVTYAQRTTQAGSTPHTYRSATVGEYVIPDPFGVSVGMGSNINGVMDTAQTGSSGYHSHGFDIPGTWSSPRNPARPHNTMPPFYVLTFIMRVR